MCHNCTSQKAYLVRLPGPALFGTWGGQITGSGKKAEQRLAYTPSCSQVISPRIAIAKAAPLYTNLI